MHWLKSPLKTHWLITIPFLFFSGLSLQGQSADMPRPSPKASVSQTNEEFHFEVEENQAQIKKWQALMKQE